MTCQKAHAAAFNSTAFVRRDAFRWLSGQTVVTKYESSPGKFRHFCSACGSQLIGERPEDSRVVLRVATLDEGPDIAPTRHIWVAHDRPWMYFWDLPAFNQWPV
jgi:ADP-ribosyl-[dinitrogen reductase] hydrolase